MANTSNINNLPFDILLDILLLLDDVQELFSVISTNKHIHAAFQPRRSLILGRVFERQISQQLSRLQRLYPSSKYGSPGAVYNDQILRIARTVEHTIEGCNNDDTEDILTLDAAAWKAFKAFDCRPSVLNTIGMKIVSRCIALDRRDLALQYAREIRDLSVSGEGQDQGQGQDLSSEQKQLFRQFARMFNNAGMQREAQELIVHFGDNTSASPNLLLCTSERSTSKLCGTTEQKNEALASLKEVWQSNATVLRMGGYKEDESIECQLRNIGQWTSLYRTCCEASVSPGQADSVYGRLKHERMIGTSLVITV